MCITVAMSHFSGGKAFGLLKAQQREKLEEVNKVNKLTLMDYFLFQSEIIEPPPFTLVFPTALSVNISRVFNFTSLLHRGLVDVKCYFGQQWNCLSSILQQHDLI